MSLSEQKRDASRHLFFYLFTIVNFVEYNIYDALDVRECSTRKEIVLQYRIRKLHHNETDLLQTFLYEAIFIPDDVEPPPKEIVEQPELRVYTDGFGSRPGDNCLVAEVDGKVVGAVWTRIMNDYGHIDDETPSFAISLFKEYRGFGIGTRLMEEMLALLRSQGYRKASLSVQKENYAVKLYKKVGFMIIDENAEEYIMVCEL